MLSEPKRAAVIAQLKKECESREIPMPDIIGPATWGVPQGINELKKIKKNGNADLYSGFCTHKYQGTTEDWVEFIKLAKSMGKIAVNDESSTGVAGRTHGVVENLNRILRVYSGRSAAYRAGLDGELFFEPWSRGIDSETRAIYFTRNQKAKRLRGYWILKDFATYAAGSTYIPTASKLNKKGVPLETMCFQKDGSTALWIVNNTDHDMNDVDVKLTGPIIRSQEPVTHRQWTDKIKTDKGATSTMKIGMGNKVTLDIPQRSIHLVLFR